MFRCIYSYIKSIYLQCVVGNDATVPLDIRWTLK